jgi:pimeloyl-ACP methyl ester carboxylesterase
MLNIKKKFTYAKNSKELFIIFPPWTGRFYLNTLLRKYISRKNCSVLEYEFPKQILSANWKKVLENFLFIKQQTLSDVSALKQKYEFERINVIGISLGCINACMIANNNIDVKKLHLILPGHCLAESLWEGESTQEIRDDLDDNYNLSNLKEYWRDLAPENNIDNLKIDDISVFLSEADKSIPFDHGKRFLEQLQSYNYPIEYKIAKHLKHSFAAIFFYLLPSKFSLFTKENR